MVALALAIAAPSLPDQSPSASEPSLVVQPHAERPDASRYYGLLTPEVPTNRYGRASVGGTCAWTFTGDPTFVKHAYNLLTSFGWDGLKRSGKRHSLVAPYEEQDQHGPTLHRGAKPGTWFMLMRADWVHTAVRRYLFGQLYQDPSKARKVRVYGPEEDDPMCGSEVVCLNADALMEEAAQLATSFLHYEMELSYGIVEDPFKDHRQQSNHEYGTYLFEQLMRRTQEPEQDTDA